MSCDLSVLPIYGRPYQKLLYCNVLNSTLSCVDSLTLTETLPRQQYRYGIQCYVDLLLAYLTSLHTFLFLVYFFLTYLVFFLVFLLRQTYFVFRALKRLLI